MGKGERGRRIVKGLGKGETKGRLREYGIYVCVMNQVMNHV